ncbi:MAG: AbrB/MazE/SpoVT family DNA-binding domain-containing protein [Nitrospirota bacterium]|nr:AbrB/MazE/SpoVT family DNA-binding domain-containing protein [Nitrospirota bacterium]
MEATLTSKGQVTIPKEIRDALGLRAGNRMDFFILEKDGMLRLVPPGVSIATPLQPFNLLNGPKRGFSSAAWERAMPAMFDLRALCHALASGHVVSASPKPMITPNPLARVSIYVQFLRWLPRQKRAMGAPV